MTLPLLQSTTTTMSSIADDNSSSTSSPSSTAIPVMNPFESEPSVAKGSKTRFKRRSSVTQYNLFRAEVEPEPEEIQAPNQHDTSNWHMLSGNGRSRATSTRGDPHHDSVVTVTSASIEGPIPPPSSPSFLLNDGEPTDDPALEKTDSVSSSKSGKASRHGVHPLAPGNYRLGELLQHQVQHQEHQPPPPPPPPPPPHQLQPPSPGIVADQDRQESVSKASGEVPEQRHRQDGEVGDSKSTMDGVQENKAGEAAPALAPPAAATGAATTSDDGMAPPPAEGRRRFRRRSSVTRYNIGNYQPEHREQNAAAAAATATERVSEGIKHHSSSLPSVSKDVSSVPGQNDDADMMNTSHRSSGGAQQAAAPTSSKDGSGIPGQNDDTDMMNTSHRSSREAEQRADANADVDVGDLEQTKSQPMESAPVEHSADTAPRRRFGRRNSVTKFSLDGFVGNSASQSEPASVEQTLVQPMESASVEQPSDAPAPRKRFGRRNSVTKFSLEGFMGDSSEQNHAQRNHQEKHATSGGTGVTAGTSQEDTAKAKPVFQVAAPSTQSSSFSQRPRYFRRSSVTQFNLAAFQPQYGSAQDGDKTTESKDRTPAKSDAGTDLDEERIRATPLTLSVVSSSQSQKDPPPSRNRYMRRSSVTQYNLALYQPHGAAVKNSEGSNAPTAFSLFPDGEGTKGQNGGYMFSGEDQKTGASTGLMYLPNQSTPSLRRAGRQRYGRRSSVTQYNLGSYQPQPHLRQEALEAAAEKKEDQAAGGTKAPASVPDSGSSTARPKLDDPMTAKQIAALCTPAGAVTSKAFQDAKKNDAQSEATAAAKTEDDDAKQPAEEKEEAQGQRDIGHQFRAHQRPRFGQESSTVTEYTMAQARANNVASLSPSAAEESSLRRKATAIRRFSVEHMDAALGPFIDEKEFAGDDDDDDNDSNKRRQAFAGFSEFTQPLSSGDTKEGNATPSKARKRLYSRRRLSSVEASSLMLGDARAGTGSEDGDDDLISGMDESAYDDELEQIVSRSMSTLSLDAGSDISSEDGFEVKQFVEFYEEEMDAQSHDPVLPPN